MPPIDGMANILTVCLGRNIRFNLVIQAYSQLEKSYGDDWKTIDGNTNNTFYILTDDHTTAEMISKKIGEETIVVKSRSGETLSLDKSKTENLESRPLLNADELMRLQEGEMIVIRTIKRQDVNRRRIQQFPIFNTDETKMKYRWEYLNDYYDTSKSINDIEIPCEHANIVLDEVRAIFDIKGSDKPTELRTFEPPEELRIFESPKTSSQEVGLTNISNGASAVTSKPPKPKNERMEEAKQKQDDLIKEKEQVETSTTTNDEKTSIATQVENTNATNDESVQVQEGNELNEDIFKQAVIKGTFEEVFGENFHSLSYEEVKNRLNLYQENFDSKRFVKLQAMVDEGLT